jgi:hypothetical protein
MLHVTETLAIAEWELSESFMRASGLDRRRIAV